MTREEKIISAMCDNLSTKNNSITGIDKAAAAISKLFDEEMIAFAEWMHSNTVYCGNGSYAAWANPDIDRRIKLPELLQLFKNRNSPDKQ